MGAPVLLVVSGRPKRSQDAPRELPWTPKDHPEPPDDPLGTPWNVSSLPRTYQVPSRALLTSPKGTPDAKKTTKYVAVLLLAPQQHYNIHIRFEKYVVVLPPFLINKQPIMSYQVVAVPACSFRFLPVPCFAPTQVIHWFPWIRRSRAAS